MNKVIPKKVPYRSRLNHNRLLIAMWKHRFLYMMLIPGLIYFVVFRYGPLWYAQIAFKDFSPRLGVVDSPFVGFEHFETFFKSYFFTQIFGNTLIISFAKLIVGIPAAIIVALALNETRLLLLRRVVQTLTYLPHFLSWVVVAGILLAMLSANGGLVNQAITSMGGESLAFMSTPSVFRSVIVASDVWKETGWSAILYLAALVAIDPTLYEAAAVDGATRLQRIWHISLPGMRSVIVLITLLRLGNILDAGFGQILVVYSLPVYSVSDIIDTWVYRQGILNFQFSVATAVGLFKGLVGFVLIVSANKLARMYARTGLF